MVAFVDFDQELLAPRYRASEQALALLARAARILGPRDRNGRLVVQTRNPQHPVLDGVLHADPARMTAGELERRRELGFPPATALAAVSGAASEAFIETFGAPLGVDVLARSTIAGCCAPPITARSATPWPRPPAHPGRARVEVDPLRI